MNLTDQEVIDMLHDAQQNWQHNGLGNLSVREMQDFHEYVEEKEKAARAVTLTA
jgi:hypothetical protein